MKNYVRVSARINLDAVLFNIEQLKKRLSEETKILAVVKMDGYGHGAVPISEMLEEVDSVWGYATATFGEAVLLKKAKVKKPVLVLGCIFPEQYGAAVKKEIRATVYTREMAKGLSKAAVKAGRTAYFHIKIDTGMGRLGFPPDKETEEAICAIAKLPNVAIEGMFTHFARADEADKSFTLRQHELFMRMKAAMERKKIQIPYYHCDNSAGIIDLPEMGHDLARAGISIYGLYPSEEVNKEAVRLKPALELLSHVIFVKEVQKGAPISYGGTFVADRVMKVATIPVGYGDGYPRALSNKADVLIRGKRARILGRVCMDQFMVDVTDIPDVSFMDEVVLVGSMGDEHISVEELSEISGRFNYEFVCCLDRRVPRIYIKGGKKLGRAEYFS